MSFLIIALSLQDKAVIVVGGGDTGTDCIGTSVRHGARQVGSHALLTTALSATLLAWCMWCESFSSSLGSLLFEGPTQTPESPLRRWHRIPLQHLDLQCLASLDVAVLYGVVACG